MMMKNGVRPLRPGNVATGAMSALAAAAVFAVLALTHAAPARAQIELRLNSVESYIPDLKVKRKMKRAYRPELDRLRDTMMHRMKGGEQLLCSAQIATEVQWLIHYTNRPADIERRMQDLRDSLKEGDQPLAMRQDPRDGSFGRCHEAWIWRFFSSVDPLKHLARQGKAPEQPLKIWDPVSTPEKLTAYMRSLLISDLDSGHNKRKELNLAVTALGQLLWFDYTARVFPSHLDRDALAEALKKFVDEEWQDPETAYWGAWYRDGGEIRRTNDLSMTFHIVSYRKGDVKRLKDIARTTFAIRNVRYPYGWDGNGLQNNHHAYDVVRILNLTWDELDTSSRANARAAIFLLTARSLGLSINGKGEFDPSPYNTVGEAYYFGISFLEVAGLFGNDTPRTHAVVITNTEGLLKRIEENLRKLDRSDPMVVAAEHKLGELKR